MIMTSSTTRSIRTVQNFRLVWLNENIDEVQDNNTSDCITRFRQMVNTVDVFYNIDECIDFITDIQDELILMVVSEEFQDIVLPIAQEISQVNSLYIFSRTEVQCQKSAKKWLKMQGIFTDITDICEALKHAIQVCDQNLISISFVKENHKITKKDLDTLDSSFMYTQILKEILLTIDFNQNHINEFLSYCREQFVGNNTTLGIVEKLQMEYHHNKPIWWYTYNCFLYPMLNRALRLMEIDIILKIGFFLKDLHNDIATLYTQQYGAHHHSNSFFVYRGQGLCQKDFDELQQTKGGLLSFNNFLSTSISREVAFVYAESNSSGPDMVGVLFEITVHPSTASCPFADIKHISHFQDENEILFAMHPVFRIEQVKQIGGNNRLWQVDLTLTNDNDPQLHALTECIREETFSGYKGWYRLGYLLIMLGQFDKAELVFDTILDQTTDEREKASSYQMLGMVKHKQGKYAEAVEYYEKSIEIIQKILSPTHHDLGGVYNNLGGVYDSMGQYLKALSCYENALEIFQKILSENDPRLAATYNNIGLVYANIKEYTKALDYCEKSLKISQKTLPANHPSLANLYTNIGEMYQKTNKHSRAILYHEKAFDIYKRALPTNHPQFATIYNNVGATYHRMNEYSKALLHYEKAFQILQTTLTENHPLSAISAQNIVKVYDSMGEYLKALPYHEKLIKIKQQTLPESDPDLADSYIGYGHLLHRIGQTSEALLWFERALDIFEHSFPPDYLYVETLKKCIEKVKETL